MTVLAPPAARESPETAGPTPAARRRRDTIRPGSAGARAGMGLLWLVLAAILIVPTLAFLVIAFSPHLFGQGKSWLTLANLRASLSGVTLRGMVDSLSVSAVAAVAATAIGIGLAWVVSRTTTRGRRAWTLGLWAILIVPTYVVGVGWEEIFGPSGLLRDAGLAAGVLSVISHLFFSGFGVTVVLAFRGVPFAYFATSVALAGVGQDLEDAVRVHGGNRWSVVKIVTPVLAPALFASLVIVFAESIGDFGVAATIAVVSNFPVATYQLFTSISSFPASFGVAAVIGWLLVASVGITLLIQHRVTRSRSYAVLGGRTRPARARDLGPGARAGVAIATWGFFAAALGVPILGAVVSSFLPPLESISIGHLTLRYYAQILHSSSLGGSMLFSLRMALICSTAAVVLATVVARLLSARRLGLAARLLDLTLLAAVAIPGIVFAAGYIFVYNLRFWSDIGVDLYGTVILLGMAYAAGALPTTARLLTGPMSQIQGSLLAAARVHGASGPRAWRKGALPLIARSLLWAWLLAFSGIFLELPVSEMLAPAGVTPVSVAITQSLNKSDLVEGAALSVAAVVLVLVVIAAALAAWRLLAPDGWNRIGGRLS